MGKPNIHPDERNLPWAFLAEAIPDKVSDYWTLDGPTNRTWTEREEGFDLSFSEAAAVRVALDLYNGSGKAPCAVVLGYTGRMRRAYLRFYQALESESTRRAYLHEVLEACGHLAGRTKGGDHVV